MLRFDCDYSEGAAPEVLALLTRTNTEQTAAYGTDLYCDAARRRIRALCGAPDADIHFFVGATQVNLTVIGAALRPWQGVLCAGSGHIAVHETGAIEATGHKCLTLPAPQGKITAAQVRDACAAHWRDVSHEHTVQPGMAYVSNPTEYGTLYTRAELAALSAACRENGIPLFLDGARLAFALAAPGSDLTLPDYAALCDAFYLGGTKCGALFGEALVLTNPALQKDFRYALKQRGGLLAKGRLLGLQFLALLGEDGPLAEAPYLRLARHADALAARLRAALAAKGYALPYESPTNQQFAVLPNRDLEILSKKYLVSVGDAADAGRTAVRFCTSWATRDDAVDALLAELAAL